MIDVSLFVCAVLAMVLMLVWVATYCLKVMTELIQKQTALYESLARLSEAINADHATQRPVETNDV